MFGYLSSAVRETPCNNHWSLPHFGRTKFFIYQTVDQQEAHMGWAQDKYIVQGQGGGNNGCTISFCPTTGG